MHPKDDDAVREVSKPIKGWRVNWIKDNFSLNRLPAANVRLLTVALCRLFLWRSP